MRLLLRLRRDARAPAHASVAGAVGAVGAVDDVEVDAAADTTVHELATALRAHAGRGPASDPLGLVVDPTSPTPRVLPPEVALGDAGLRDGDEVAVTRRRLVAEDAAPLAVVEIVAGPDAPAAIPLTTPSVLVGRAPEAGVRLRDPLVSKRHARLHVGDPAELVDVGSANGVVVSGRTVARALLRVGDTATLGDTTIRMTRVPGAHGRVVLNRSPRLDPPVPHPELAAPEPPSPPSPPRFPVVMLAAPILMAAAIYAITRSATVIVFVALSPLMMISSWVEQRAAGRRRLATETERFRAALADLVAGLDDARARERAARHHAHPATVEVVDAVAGLSSLVWTRRPEHRSFGHVRLGLGTLPSHTTVRMPTTSRAVPELAAELTALVDSYATISEVPVVADPGCCGNVGVAGRSVDAVAFARGIVAQLTGLHAPGELRLVVVGPADRWDWTKWLPHRFAAADRPADVADVAAVLEAELATRRSRAGGDGAGMPLVVVVVDSEGLVDRARFVWLAEHGPEVGISVVWVAASVVDLPAACRIFADLDANTGRGRVGHVPSGTEVDDLRVELVGAEVAERFARRLAAVVDGGCVSDDATALPNAIGLVDLIGHDAALDAAAIEERWSMRERFVDGRRHPASRDLRAIVGQSADGPIALDLRADGPHALVGGTTGSGKSEFLQSWIISMAATHPPTRVTFLLVDYKGGAAFAECVRLPHCVGLVTDLGPQLAQRALASLDAELRHRERVLRDRGVKDLAELEGLGDACCPPSLVIVVDEFATLVAEVPEFVDGVVDIAQRGRSLGLHLVLATQRPAGAIRDNLRANTDLRIALRMVDESDSLDVIGSRDAAAISRDLPGRAVVALGSGRLTAFQSAWVGGRLAGRCTRTPPRVRSFRFGPPPPWPLDASAADRPTAGPTDLSRFVDTIVVAARRAGLPAPRRPWLPELSVRYRLESLPSAHDGAALVVGVADDVAGQDQPVVAFVPDTDGHLAVLGTSGSGTSTALRSIAVAAGLGAAHGAPCRVDAIDCRGHALRMLTVLPHVGGVVAGDDAERVERLLRSLLAEIAERAAAFGAVGAPDLVRYRAATGDRSLPRRILLLDGLGAFRARYEGGVDHRWWDALVTLAAEGRSVGVHLVVSADRPAALPSALGASIPKRLVLRLADDLDAVPGDATGARDLPPGRGRLDGRVVQVAVAGGAADPASERSAIEAIAIACLGRGVPAAEPIVVLPDRVTRRELPALDAGFPVIGLDHDSLEPITIDPRGTFLVAGRPRSGRTTAVESLVVAVAAIEPSTRRVLVSARPSPLAGALEWDAVAVGSGEVAVLCSQLLADLAEGHRGRRPVLVVEAIGELVNGDADLILQELVTAVRGADGFVVAEGETGSLTPSWPLLQSVRVDRAGVVLQPDQHDGDTLLRTTFPRPRRGEFPPGRGLLVQSGRVHKVQLAVHT